MRSPPPQTSESFAKRDTNFLRALGILIVVNSHLDAYYPSARFATGGAIGNALFFALSSFGLVVSLSHRPLPFPEWCARRILRLYPEIWVALVLYWLPLQIVTGTLAEVGTLSLLGNLFYPPWWFVQVLLVLYPLAFLLVRLGRVQGVYWVFAIAGVLYAFFYVGFLDLSIWTVEQLPFKIISCLLSFAMGAWLAHRNDLIRYRGGLDIAALAVILLLFLGQKVALSQGLFLKFQFLQQWLLLPLVYFAFKASRSPWVQERVMQSRLLAPGLDWLSRRTLTLYMAHTALVGPLLLWPLPFPLNVIVFLGASLGLTALAGWLADRLQRRLETW